jgi:threonylcarbamoyladenosine tRNA methylthiotransferase MtaB
MRRRHRPERYAALPEVDRVLDNRAKLRPQSYLQREAAPADVAESATHLVDGFEGKSRAFLQVQQGCDHRCTFASSYARGRADPCRWGLLPIRRAVSSRPDIGKSC